MSMQLGKWASSALIALVLAMALPGMTLALDVDKLNVESFAMWNEAMANGDYDKAASFMAQNGVRIHPLAGEIKGRQAMRDFFAALDKDFGGQHCTVTWHTGNGNKAAAAFTWEATQRATGKRVKLPILLVSEFNAKGEIVWQQEMFDSGAFNKQLE